MSVAKFIGVYSSLMNSDENQGSKRRKQYWFVWEDKWGNFRIQLLNSAYQAVGSTQVVSKKEIDQFFNFEPNIFAMPTSKLEIDDAEEFLYSDNSQDLSDIEYLLEDNDEYSTQEALKILETDNKVKEDFALGFFKLKSGNQREASLYFNKVLARTDLVEAHKHSLTEFAVDLRKQKLFAMAFKYYRKIIELSPNDSNAYFNMARVMFDLRDYDGCKKNIDYALNIDPYLVEAEQFRIYLKNFLKRKY